jgi:class 3 adenylate cyclase/tetratricopeptide (TPR) repeat protein
MRCRVCEAENGRDARCCMSCGADLRVHPSPAAKASTVLVERRQITVLFCDIVDATAISQRLDPEDLLDLLREYWILCEAVLGHHDGHRAQFLGDGVLAYFGYPVAQEDAPERAVRAGLMLARALLQWGPRIRASRGVDFRFRIGIHTGSVVVGSELLAVGETPNLAARVQEAASPGCVLVSEATERLTRGFFDFTDLGPQTLKGFSQQVRLYQARGETGARSKLEVSAAGGLTPFVGREGETGSLTEKWREAGAGRGPVVLLTGEPGIGKSRHVRVLKERLAHEAAGVLECYCSPTFQSSALRPVIEMIEHRLGFPRGSSPEQQIARIEVEVAQAGLDPATAVPIIASLLAVPLGNTYSLPDLLPAKQRQVTFEVLLDWLSGITRRWPVLLVFEDLHWADPSTLDFIGLLIQRETSVAGPLMTILTYRPEFRPPWTSPRLYEISLTRLPPAETEKMLLGLMKDRPLPPEVVAKILAKADGVPLYVEEITKAVLESSSGGGSGARERSTTAPLEIPSTIQDSLAARLDRLGGGKKVAQLCATIGRTFPFELLHAISDMSEYDLRAELDRLVGAGLLFHRGDAAGGAYIFKHALIQDSAYQSLLRKTRQEVHQRIAQALKERFPTLAETQPELLAQHYAGAGMPKEGIRQWELVGQQAIARSAYGEAVTAFENARELLVTLPGSEERDRKEVELLCGLGLAFISVKGWSTTEVEQTYGKAHELSLRFGDIPIRVLFGMWAVYVVRGDRERTAQLLPRMHHILDHSRDPNELLIANAMVGGRCFWSADYRVGIPILREGKGYVDRAEPRRQAIELFSGYGYEGQLYPHVFLAWTDAVQGRKRQAADGIRETIEIARATRHPYVKATALSFGGAVAHELGDVADVAERGAELAQLATEHGFPFFLANALSFTGWVALKNGDAGIAIKHLSDAVAIYRAVGGNVVLGYYLSYLAEALMAVGRIDEALGTIDDALRSTKTNLAVFCEPELHRLKGEILLRKEDGHGAEQSLRSAYALAVQQEAALYEARASMSLARILLVQGQASESQRLVQRGLQCLDPDELTVEHRQLLELATSSPLSDVSRRDNLA